MAWRPREAPGGHLQGVGRLLGPDLNEYPVPTCTQVRTGVLCRTPDARPHTINPRTWATGGLSRTCPSCIMWNDLGTIHVADTKTADWTVKRRWIVVMKSEICCCTQKGRANLSPFCVLFLAFCGVRWSTDLFSFVLSCDLFCVFSVEKPAHRSPES